MNSNKNECLIIKEESNIIRIAEAFESVKSIESEIENEIYRSHSDLWYFADVRINNINSPKKIVITPSAMISKLILLMQNSFHGAFYQIRDIFYSKNLIQNISKYELFGRLADAADKYHKTHGDGNEKDLLREISNEAMKILKEMFKSVNHGIS